jgi:pimeloyl-ACP methyl ester carboxylesterase
MTQTFTAPDGTKLAYYDEGEGLPVLCLAGLTRNSADFDYVAPHLSDVRLIRMDYRGRGDSDYADPATYTIPQESADAQALLDHLGLQAAAILGTSRGGLIALTLAATAKDRLLGVCLNDIGPELDPDGLALIKDYIGKTPAVRSLDDLAATRARLLPGFPGVPLSRWRDEAEKNYTQTEDGLQLRYDARLAEIFNQPAPDDDAGSGDAWPFFEALAGLPIALIRGANSNLLAEATADEMRRRPDMGYANVPDRGHVPFLDEPEAVAVIRRWIEGMQ